MPLLTRQSAVEVDDFLVDEAFIEGPPPRAKTPTLEKGFEEAEWGIWVPSYEVVANRGNIRIVGKVNKPIHSISPLRIVPKCHIFVDL